MVSLEDEIQVLVAVYDDILVSWHPSSEFVELRKECIPRTDQRFVSVALSLHITSDYPSNRPIIKVIKSSGFDDDGNSMLEKIDNFYKTDSFLLLEEGDPYLFQLFEYIYDILDSNNEGQCLICSESLNQDNLPNAGSFNEFYGLKTSCSHCFHTHCLIRWASLSIIAQDKSKSSRSERETEELQLRSLEGYVTMYRKDIDGLLANIAKLQAEKIVYECQINEKLSALTSDFEVDLKRSIEALQAVQINDTKRTKSKSQRNQSSSDEKLRAHIAKLESRLRDISTEFQANLLKNKVPEKLSLDACEVAIVECETKISKLKLKLDIAERDVSTARASAHERRMLSEKQRSFPCPNCRLNLTAATCLPSASHDQLSIFDGLLAAAVREVHQRSALGADIDTSGDSLGENGVAVVVEKVASVSELPVDVQAYVRSVQSYQSNLRSQLKCFRQVSSSETCKTNSDTSSYSIESQDMNYASKPKARGRKRGEKMRK